jgi:thiol-disulfide isomerase/thioredoxin
MKRVIIYSLSLLISLFSSCDIIKPPYIENGEKLPVNSDQNVLLELFTGHQCSNCPAAETIIEQLKNLYGEKLNIIAYHTGFYALPSEKFPVDFRTEEGNELESYFQVQFYPSGMVNRVLDRQSYLLNPTEWAPLIADQLNHNDSVSIELSANIDSLTRICIANVKVLVSSSICEELKLSVFLTEDSLVSAQSLSGNPLYPEGIVPDYVHMHVFRESFNGTWGDLIFKQGTANQRSGSFTFSKTLNSNYKINNCRITAFVYSDHNKGILNSISCNLALETP